jgi:hypothetical protein
MKDQKIRFAKIDNNYNYDLVFQEIEKELEEKLWEIFDREKNRKNSKQCSV